MAGDQENDASVHQDVSPSRDAYVAGRDVHVHHIGLMWQPPAVPPTVRTHLRQERPRPIGRSQGNRLLTDAARAALTLDDNPFVKACVLAEVIRAAAVAAPERVAWLAAEAETTARSDWEPGISYALTRIAIAVAAADPERAEALVLSIEHERDRLLGSVASALAAVDPERAEALARLAQYVDDRMEALARVAYAVASTDPERAAWLAAEIEALAPSMNGTHGESSARMSVARALAVVAPERAEAVARSIKDVQSKSEVLADLARAVASTNPVWAARLAADLETAVLSSSDPKIQALLLSDIAETLALVDQERLARLAVGVESTLRSAKEKIPQPDGLSHERDWYLGLQIIDLEHGLRRVLIALAMVDSGRAEVIARSVENARIRPEVLSRAAVTLAEVDPERAEIMARSIETEDVRITTMAKIAFLLVRQL